MWSERDDENLKPFVDFVQFFSKKTATALKRMALVAYPVCTVLLNVLARKK